MMLKFIYCFFTAMALCNFNPLNLNPLECVSMNNQKCKIRSEIISVNTDELVFYPYSITINKCKGSCNTINDPYAKLCVPDVIKNVNVKVFNLISRINETRHIEWHKTCKCKSILDANVGNHKQRWNEEKYRCECKQLIDKGICDEELIWNPSNCECECDKSYGIGEYLDYKSCKCRNKIIDKLIEECSKNIDGNEMFYNETLNAIPLNAISLNTISLNTIPLDAKARNFCTIYIVLFVIFFIISISISSVFIYFHWHLKKDNVHIQFNSNTQTTIY